MDYLKALEVSEILRNQGVHFKDLDIAAQTTQLNGLIKYATQETDNVTLKPLLEKLIRDRQLRLRLSLEVMCALESRMSPELQVLMVDH